MKSKESRNTPYNIGMRLRERANKGTPFKIRKTYLGWLFIIISIGLIVAGGIYYIQGV